MTKPETARKHRMILEVTFNRALSEADAVQAAQILLDHVDIQARPIWASDPEVYVDKFQAKSLTKVLPYLPRTGGWKG